MILVNHLISYIDVESVKEKDLRLLVYTNNSNYREKSRNCSINIGAKINIANEKYKSLLFCTI